jgi:hypothetical protein
MSKEVIACQPGLRLNRDASRDGAASVTVCSLDRELLAYLRSSTRSGELLKSIFRVTVAEGSSREVDDLPDVSGRYLLLEQEVEFIPHFPFEKDLKYRARFDPRRLGASLATEPLVLEFLIASEQNAPTFTEVTTVFPSRSLLPENLLRFYVCFSNPMQRGRVAEEISLLDGDGQRVSDALYRAPVELWDGSMRYLTVLLDPGRLKRWVGPNVELGPPLKDKQKYTLEIGSGMIDLYGHSLRTSFRKHFVVGHAVREHISVEHWNILPPATGTRQDLTITFPRPLDWALLLRTITIGATDGSAIDGQVAVDQCETRWSFTPSSPWIAGVYHIRVAPSLEDVCGNNIIGAFEKPLRNGLNLATAINESSLIIRLV